MGILTDFNSGVDGAVADVQENFSGLTGSEGEGLDSVVSDTDAVDVAQEEASSMADAVEHAEQQEEDNVVFVTTEENKAKYSTEQVKEFQKENNLKEDGIYGDKTQGAYEDAYIDKLIERDEAIDTKAKKQGFYKDLKAKGKKLAKLLNGSGGKLTLPNGSIQMARASGFKGAKIGRTQRVNTDVGKYTTPRGAQSQSILKRNGLY